LEQLNSETPLLLSAERIPREMFEREFPPLCAATGRPAKPIRLMVGLLLLKRIENLSDERVVEVGVQNPYYQAFVGWNIVSGNFPASLRNLSTFANA
jgi:IS5 family transposase